VDTLGSPVRAIIAANISSVHQTAKLKDTTTPTKGSTNDNEVLDLVVGDNDGYITMFVHGQCVSRAQMSYTPISMLTVDYHMGMYVCMYVVFYACQLIALEIWYSVDIMNGTGGDYSIIAGDYGGCLVAYPSASSGGSGGGAVVSGSSGGMSGARHIWKLNIMDIIHRHNIVSSVINLPHDNITTINNTNTLTLTHESSSSSPSPAWRTSPIAISNDTSSSMTPTKSVR
jgi:hypothetical protein